MATKWCYVCMFQCTHKNRSVFHIFLMMCRLIVGFFLFLCCKPTFLAKSNQKSYLYTFILYFSCFFQTIVHFCWKRMAFFVFFSPYVTILILKHQIRPKNGWRSKVKLWRIPTLFWKRILSNTCFPGFILIIQDRVIGRNLQ